VWLIVDVIARPDLAVSVRDGSLRSPWCENCQQHFSISAPLLLFAPPPVPTLLLVVPEESAETAASDGQTLLEILAEGLGPFWDADWLGAGVPFVAARSVVPPANDDMRAWVTTLAAGARRADGNADDVVDYLTSPSWSRARTVLESSDGLLTDEGIGRLVAAASSLTSMPSDLVRARIDAALRARRDGIEVALGPLAAAESALGRTDVPVEASDLIAELFKLDPFSAPREVVVRSTVVLRGLHQGPEHRVVRAVIMGLRGLALTQWTDGDAARRRRQGLRWLRRCRDLLDPVETPEQWFTAQLNLATALIDSANSDRSVIREAIDAAKAALIVAGTGTVVEAQLLHTIGNGYARRTSDDPADDIELAIAYHSKAERILRAAGAAVEWATAAKELAADWVARIGGDPDENLTTAMTLYEDVLTATRTLPEGALHAQVLVDRAGALLGHDLLGSTDVWERTVGDLREAIDVLARVGKRAPHAQALRLLGIIVTERPDVDAATLREGIAHLRTVEVERSLDRDPQGWGSIQMALGNAYARSIDGQPFDSDSAETAHKAALEAFSLAGDSLAWAHTQVNLANLYETLVDQGDESRLVDAIRCLGDALSVLTPERTPADCLRASRRLGDLLVRAGQFDEAFVAYQMAMAAVDFTIGPLVSPHRREAALRTVGHAADGIVHAGLRIRDRSRADRETLLYSTLSKSRLFITQLGLAELPVPSGVPPDMATEERDLREQLRSYEERITAAESGESPTATLSANRARTRERLERLWNQMVHVNPGAAGYVAFRRSERLTWHQLTEAARLVAPDGPAALIDMYALDDELVVFLMRSDRADPIVQRRPIGRDKLYYRYLLPYQEECLNRPALWRARREPTNGWLSLGEELLGGLAGELDEVAIAYVAPHRELHLVPLHALTVGGEPLISRTPIVYVPSLAVLPLLLSRGAPPDAATCTALGYTPVPGQEDVFHGEAAAVAELFGTNPLLGRLATRSAFTSAASHSHVVHLSCHGKFQRGDPMESAVILADGAMTARDVFGEDINTKLVTLSACQAGFADVGAGDELVGWTRALLYAGSRAALTPLWSVDAHATLQWMRDFYEAWTVPTAPSDGGITLASAHQQATLAAYRRDPDPWLWASFVLTGDGRQSAEGRS
jgi:CHAT domain-containing protein